MVLHGRLDSIELGDSVEPVDGFLMLAYMVVETRIIGFIE